MIFNRTYSILMHGKPANEGYGRRIDWEAYRASPDEISQQWLSRLVDYSGATADQRSANAEWLIQLMLRSSVRDAFLTFDPLNTYEKVPATSAIDPTIDWAALLAELTTERPRLARILNTELIWTDELLWTTQLASFTFNVVQDNALN